MISVVLSYARKVRNGANVSDVKHDPGGGANETGEHFQAPNADCVPLPGDYAATVPVQRTGGEVPVGFIDPKQNQTAKPGESRVYARDASGTEVAQVYVKNDGTVETSNDNGSTTLSPDGTITAQGPVASGSLAADGTITLTNGPGSFIMAPDGTVTINGFTILPTGAASSPVSVEAPLVGGATMAAGSALTLAGVPVADSQHTHGPGSYAAGGDAVSGVSSPSNG